MSVRLHVCLSIQENKHPDSGDQKRKNDTDTVELKLKVQAKLRNPPV